MGCSYSTIKVNHTNGYKLCSWCTWQQANHNGRLSTLKIIRTKLQTWVIKIIILKQFPLKRKMILETKESNGNSWIVSPDGEKNQIVIHVW